MRAVLAAAGPLRLALWWNESPMSVLGRVKTPTWLEHYLLGKPRAELSETKP
jgi:hypothetical protein